MRVWGVCVCMCTQTRVWVQSPSASISSRSQRKNHCCAPTVPKCSIPSAHISKGGGASWVR